MMLATKVITGILHAQNKGACDWLVKKIQMSADSLSLSGVKFGNLISTPVNDYILKYSSQF